MVAMGEDGVALGREPKLREILRQASETADLHAADIVEIALAIGVGAYAIGDLADLMGDMADMGREALPLRGDRLARFSVVARPESGNQHRLAILEAHRFDLDRIFHVNF